MTRVRAVSATVTRQAGIGNGHAEFIAACGLPVDGLEHVWAMFIAKDVAGLAGIAALERHGPVGGSVFLLRSVAVRADCRSSGLGAVLVTAALDAADVEAGGPAVVGLLTETAGGYFDRFGFTRVDRSALPSELMGSAELAGACPASAMAYLRCRQDHTRRRPPYVHVLFVCADRLRTARFTPT